MKITLRQKEILILMRDNGLIMHRDYYKSPMYLYDKNNIRFKDDSKNVVKIREDVFDMLVEKHLIVCQDRVYILNPYFKTFIDSQ